jgi:hypothetical protein
LHSEPPTALLLINAFLLGLRHGIDWDHIAAIFDIVGFGSYPQTGLPKPNKSSLLASFCYATGHGLVVVALGTAAICFSSTLPEWIDPIMERTVGFTLLALGAWVLYSACKHIASGTPEQFKVQSRGLMLIGAIQSLTLLLRRITDKNAELTALTSNGQLGSPSYNSSTAFAVGLVHGIGAETGSQILLLTAVASTSQTIGMAMLLTFVLGLLTCNAAVALAGTTGFMSAARIKPVMLTLGFLTALFSIVVGSFFAFGLSDKLPDLQKILP